MPAGKFDSMTQQELKEEYSKLSNQELLSIIDKKFDYTELAVTVAIQEMGNRNISESDIADYKTEQIRHAENFIKRNIIDDLTILQKNLFFFLWLPLITFSFKRNFNEDGYLLKLKQANYYSLLGFISFVLVAIASTLFDLTNSFSIGLLILLFLPVYFFDEYFNRQQQIERLRKIFERRSEEPASAEDVTDANN